MTRTVLNFQDASASFTPPLLPVKIDHSMGSLAEDFDQLAVRLSEALRESGVAKEPFVHPRRIHGLPAQSQKNAAERARRQIEQMELLLPEIAEFEKLSVLCNFHKLKPVSDEVYARLGDNVAWEIIDFQLNQVYRSNLVFKLGNYSIEEYETNSPWDLFSRPQSALAKLQVLTEKLGEADHLVSLNEIAPYVIEETLSVHRAQFEIQHEFACPLKGKQTGMNRAFISAFTVRPLEPGKRVLLM